MENYIYMKTYGYMHHRYNNQNTRIKFIWGRVTQISSVKGKLIWRLLDCELEKSWYLDC